MDFDATTLVTASYKEIQRLAKENNIKANGSREQLEVELMSLLDSRGAASDPAPAEAAAASPPPPPQTPCKTLDDALAAAMGSLSLTTPAAAAAAATATVQQTPRAELGAMPYKQLQSLAKAIGTPANRKRDVMIEAMLAVQRAAEETEHVDYDGEEEDDGDDIAAMPGAATAWPAFGAGDAAVADAAEVSPRLAQEEEKSVGVGDAAMDLSPLEAAAAVRSRSPRCLAAAVAQPSAAVTRLDFSAEPAPAVAAAATAMAPPTPEAAVDTEEEGSDDDEVSPANTAVPAAAAMTAAMAEVKEEEDAAAGTDTDLTDDADLADVAEAADAVTSGDAKVLSDADRLQRLVDATWYLSFVPRDRVLCALTRHETLATYKAVVDHVAGRKVQRILAEDPLSPEEVSELTAQDLTPANDGKHLVCGLTGQLLRPTRRAVDAHLGGKPRQAAIEALAAADEAEAHAAAKAAVAAAALTKKNNSRVGNGGGAKKAAGKGGVVVAVAAKPCGKHMVFGEEENEPAPLQASNIRWTYDDAEVR